MQVHIDFNNVHTGHKDDGKSKVLYTEARGRTTSLALHPNLILNSKSPKRKTAK